MEQIMKDKLGNALSTIRSFGRDINRSLPPEIRNDKTDAASDQARTGSNHIPLAIIGGLLSAVADHMLAWVNLVEQGIEEPCVEFHLFADYTLFRPIIEGLSSIVWILGPSEQDERIKRVITLAHTEVLYQRQYLNGLKDVNQEDIALQNTQQNLESLLLSVVKKISPEDENQYLGNKKISPTKILKQTDEYLKDTSGTAYRLWSLCSAHIHSQLSTAFTNADRVRRVDESKEPYLYVTADENKITEIADFISNKLIQTVIRLLNKRGYGVLKEPKNRTFANVSFPKPNHK